MKIDKLTVNKTELGGTLLIAPPNLLRSFSILFLQIFHTIDNINA